MKQQTINLKYSLAKYRALSHYLEKEGKTVDGELLNHIDQLYDTQVPEAVREFVASQNPENVPETEKPHETNPDKSSRQSTKKKQSQSDGQSETGPVLTM